MIRSSGPNPEGVREDVEDLRPPSLGVVLKIFVYTLQYR